MVEVDRRDWDVRSMKDGNDCHSLTLMVNQALAMIEERVVGSLGEDGEVEIRSPCNHNPRPDDACLVSKGAHGQVILTMFVAWESDCWNRLNQSPRKDHHLNGAVTYCPSKDGQA